MITAAATTGRRYPYMSQMARIVTEGRDLDADESFELGLRCLLDGVALLLADRVS